MRHSNQGFTLLELLAVIGIVATLAAILVASSRTVMQKAAAIECANNMRQLGTAALQYANDNNQCLPVTSHQNFDTTYGNVNGKTSWINTLQEYAGGKIVFRCPQDEISRTYTYSLNDYLTPSSGLNYWRLSLLESRSRTFLFAEAARTYANSDHFHFSTYMGQAVPAEVFSKQIAVSRHRNAANYVFADGHMETLTWPDVQQLLRDKERQFVEPLSGGQPNQPIANL